MSYFLVIFPSSLFGTCLCFYNIKTMVSTFGSFGLLICPLLRSYGQFVHVWIGAHPEERVHCAEDGWRVDGTDYVVCYQKLWWIILNKFIQINVQFSILKIYSWDEAPLWICESGFTNSTFWNIYIYTHLINVFICLTLSLNFFVSLSSCSPLYQHSCIYDSLCITFRT